MNLKRESLHDQETYNLKTNIMKKLNIIFFVAIIAIAGCSKTKEMKYSFLNSSQLKQLGIVVSDQGVFYKNHLSNYKELQERFSDQGFYCTNDIYLNSINFQVGDTLTATNKADSIFISMESSAFDFYPILIGNTKGDYSLKKIFNKEKLFPVAICMAETKLPDRSDTLIVWFKPTASLQAALPADIKVEDYLFVPSVKE
jgi:hypothetical protein